MRAARQQQGKLDFYLVNKLHVPVAFASMALLAGLIGFGALRRHDDRGSLHLRSGLLGGNFMEFAVTVGLAIVGNAVVCGVFANPHDRYGSAHRLACDAGHRDRALVACYRSPAATASNGHPPTNRNEREKGPGGGFDPPGPELPS